jgi:YVTN family beta-propeller protein
VSAIGPRSASATFVNYENPPVHPVDLSPDGATLAVCNLPDNRVELFDVTGGVPVSIGAVAVGLDPVAARFRSDTELWVANHISDSISVIDVPNLHVIATINTLDEPADVVFAGTPSRAYVSCSQVNTVQVFDPETLTEVLPRIDIDAEDPRAMAINGAGTEIYVAVFESGNASTVLGGGIADTSTLSFPPNVVNHPVGPYGGVNPPPNEGVNFTPAQNPNNPTPPRVSLIVKKNASGQWVDDNDGDWTRLVSGPHARFSGRQSGWDLPDRDLAVIDTADNSVSYATGLMNICMAVAVNPNTDQVTVVGTDGTNEIRFEPNLTGTFIRVRLGMVTPGAPPGTSIADLNAGHLDYSVSTIAQTERDKSIGDPRGIVWSTSGRGYVTGMGSNNLIVIDANGTRLAPLGDPGAATIELGAGPTGLVIDDNANRLYVLNRFDGSVSTIDTTTEAEIARVPFYDPTPAAIKIGRKHLYDTHKNSGLGHIACASCHVDARMDRLAWDLGDPSGDEKSTSGQNLGANIPGLQNGGFGSFHPMKGPMTTQTFQDIIGKEPHHWRGDRDGLEEFAGAFMGLQGDDTTLTPVEMQEFEDFLSNVFFPPNPHRNFDNTLPTDLPLTGHFTTGVPRPGFGPAGEPLPNGDAVNGLAMYRSNDRRLDANAFSCVFCHTLPLGMSTDSALNFNTLDYDPFPVGPNDERHHALVSVDGATNPAIKVAQLRNQYEKTGFDTTQKSNRAGFGLLHDGSIDSITRFISMTVFTRPFGGLANDQEVADMVALILAFSGSDFSPPAPGDIQPPGTVSHDSHAGVGLQLTISSPDDNPVIERITDSVTLDDFFTLAQADPGRIDLVVRGVRKKTRRSWFYDRVTGRFVSDRNGETIAVEKLLDLADAGAEQTYTLVPRGCGERIGIDRDLDGYYDQTERDCGSDPADPTSMPVERPGRHPGEPARQFPCAPGLGRK